MFIDTYNNVLPPSIASAIITVEGSKYTNYPNDPGGPTKYGWTLKSYRQLVNKNATVYDIKNLKKWNALYLYRQHFWDKYGSSKIENQELAITLVLAQINLGPYRPNKLLQKMDNEFCPIYQYKHGKRVYNNLEEDGILGSESIYRINHCKYLWPGYPYLLYYLYSKSPHISGVWSWARKGLMNRIFFVLHKDNKK